MSHDEFEPTLEWDGWQYITKREADTLMRKSSEWPAHPSHDGEAPEFHANHGHCDDLLATMTGRFFQGHDFKYDKDGNIVGATLYFSGNEVTGVPPYEAVEVAAWAGPMSFDNADSKEGGQE